MGFNPLGNFGVNSRGEHRLCALAKHFDQPVKAVGAYGMAGSDGEVERARAQALAGAISDGSFTTSQANRSSAFPSATVLKAIFKR
ncbi:MAG: hypothetical protein U0805_05150 [Pirellulales bacterium]